ncbi:MAG: MBL fold metallo-hydrolase [Lachnospiraceae bacterium]
MAELRVEEYTVGMVMTNCYFAVNTKTSEIVIIDPGDEAARLMQKIKESGYVPKAVLLTHGHFDHAKDARTIADHYGIQIYAQQAEQETLENPAVNLSSMGGVSESYQADCYLRDGEEMTIAGFFIQALLTPGHTAGGCCYYLKEENTIFTGDTLFCESIGRTDFPGGSYATLVRSIKESLFVLPGQTKVYAGHNDATTIGWEKEHNPFI